MRTSQITPLLLGLLVLPTCGGDDGGSKNPTLLWLAPDMAETRVKLTGTEPPPF
jgi:hypothetical protein